MRLLYVVTEADAMHTLRALLTTRLHLSGTQRAACLAAGGVLVDGAFLFANQRVPVGGVISAELPPAPPSDIPAEPELPLRVVYEDEALLVADKPAGMLVHPSAAQYAGTLLGAALGHLQRTGQPLCAHPVHRLDRGTSGLVVFAKHPHVQARWMEAMAEGLVRKQYEAWALGEYPAAAGEIDLPIARLEERGPRGSIEGSRRDESGGEKGEEERPSLRRVVRGDGQPALTRYRVLEQVEREGRTLSRVAFEPVTGRTHQLRVHSLAVGCPLLGDMLYGTEDSLALSRQLRLTAQMLHAVQLCFPHPLSGVAMHIESPARWPSFWGEKM